jgi:hypothetical protein
MKPSLRTLQEVVVRASDPGVDSDATLSVPRGVATEKGNAHYWDVFCIDFAALEMQT